MSYKSVLIILGITSIFIFSTNVTAVDTANQTVTYETQEINEISVSGNPNSLNINFAIAGFQPSNVFDATTSYTLSSNGTNKKITGSINGAMPSNTYLLVSLTAPTGATSVGWQPLSTTANNLVTGVSTVAESGLTISYQFGANVNAGVMSAAQRIVTFTITDGS